MQLYMCNIFFLYGIVFISVPDFILYYYLVLIILIVIVLSSGVV